MTEDEIRKRMAKIVEARRKKYPNWYGTVTVLMKNIFNGPPKPCNCWFCDENQTLCRPRTEDEKKYQREG